MECCPVRETGELLAFLAIILIVPVMFPLECNFQRVIQRLASDYYAYENR